MSVASAAFLDEDKNELLKVVHIYSNVSVHGLGAFGALGAFGRFGRFGRFVLLGDAGRRFGDAGCRGARLEAAGRG